MENRYEIVTSARLARTCSICLDWSTLDHGHGHFLSDRVAKFTHLHFELIRISKNWLDAPPPPPPPQIPPPPAIWVHANLEAT